MASRQAPNPKLPSITVPLPKKQRLGPRPNKRVVCLCNVLGCEPLNKFWKPEWIVEFVQQNVHKFILGVRKGKHSMVLICPTFKIPRILPITNGKPTLLLDLCSLSATKKHSSVCLFHYHIYVLVVIFFDWWADLESGFRFPMITAFLLHLARQVSQTITSLSSIGLRKSKKTNELD